MKRTAAGAALVASLLVGAPAVASAATPGPAPAAVVVPAQEGGSSEPPPPNEEPPPPPTGGGGNDEPPPPTSPRDRLNAAFDRIRAQVTARAESLPPRARFLVLRTLDRVQSRFR